MTRTEIEGWALRILDALKKGAPHEDSRVELKREWIEPNKAARRIAAHANAAGSEPILWLIGVDQANGVVGAKHVELSNWWSRVQAEFNELAPEMTDLVVNIDGHTIVALLFTTDRAPFVVKAAGDLLEVPWREGTRTKSAKRSNLVRMLAPTTRLPSFEILMGSFTIRKKTVGEIEYLVCRASMEIYVVPADDRRVVFPVHNAKLILDLRPGGRPLAFVPVIFGVAGGDKVIPGVRRASITIQVSASELIIDGPGSFRIGSSEGVITDLDGYASEGTLTAHLKPAGSTATVVLKAKLRRMDVDGTVASWFVWTEIPVADSTK
jgi:hypothetical protein